MRCAISYRCAICKQTVAPAQPRLTHLVKRQDGSIMRELAVCTLCHDALSSGKPVKSLLPGRPTDPAPVPLARHRQPPNPSGAS